MHFNRREKGVHVDMQYGFFRHRKGSTTFPAVMKSGFSPEKNAFAQREMSFGKRLEEGRRKRDTPAR